MRRTALLLLCGAMLLAGCSRATRTPVERNFLSMGTEASVTVPADAADRLVDWTGTVQSHFARLEALMTVYSPTSEISVLNSNAGIRTVPLAADNRAVLGQALRYGELSGGAFDITVGPLMHLWGFRGGPPVLTVPTPAQIQAVLPLVGYRHLRLAESPPDGGSAGVHDGAYLDQVGVEVDLGGIGKGYAVDEAWAQLVERRATNVLINLGGNMRCRGESAPGRAWRIGVRNPFDRRQLLGHLELADGMAVATSGNYERFVDIGGRRYAHIMDPRTGYPVTGMAGVTVLSPSALAADALSTTLFVMGIEAGARRLGSLPGNEALFVPDRQPIAIHVTHGMAAVFHPRPEFAGRVVEMAPRPGRE